LVGPGGLGAPPNEKECREATRLGPTQLQLDSFLPSGAAPSGAGRSQSPSVKATVFGAGARFASLTEGRRKARCTWGGSGGHARNVAGLTFSRRAGQ